MLIDFHIHAYATEVAERAVAKLVETASVNAYTDGTIGDTRKKLKEWGVDYGVLLPIATKPTQQEKINRWAIRHNRGNLICFGTVHPDHHDKENELERLSAAGIKGIKLHPDYQGHYMFDEQMEEIYAKCEELGLMVILHMGYDPYSVKERHAMPCDLAKMAEKYPSLKFIGAHMGGMNNWESVIYYLKGADNVWLDTAFCNEFMSDEMFLRLVEAFGEDKILFGSDLPWSTSLKEQELIKRAKISDSAKEKIFYKNAVKLLNP